MNVKRAISVLTFTIFTVSNLYAAPCIDCVATIVKKDDYNQKIQTQWSAKSIIKAEDKKISDETYYIDNVISLESNSDDNLEQYVDSMIALDDNAYDEESILDENQIILTDHSSVVKLAKTLYACDDIANNIIACDNEKKEECECV